MTIREGEFVCTPPHLPTDRSVGCDAPTLDIMVRIGRCDPPRVRGEGEGVGGRSEPDPAPTPWGDPELVFVCAPLSFFPAESAGAVTRHVPRSPRPPHTDPRGPVLSPPVVLFLPVFLRTPIRAVVLLVAAT